MEQIFTKLVNDFEQGKMSRRQLIQSLMVTATVAAAAPAASVAIPPAPAADDKAFNAVRFHHVGYLVTDYRKTRDFYVRLLGMKVLKDDGESAQLALGEQYFAVSNQVPGKQPGITHIAYKIADWDAGTPGKLASKDQAAVEAAFKRSGVESKKKTYWSHGDFYVTDPDGLEVQLHGFLFHSTKPGDNLKGF